MVRHHNPSMQVVAGTVKVEQRTFDDRCHRAAAEQTTRGGVKVPLDAAHQLDSGARRLEVPELPSPLIDDLLRKSSGQIEGDELRNAPAVKMWQVPP